MKRHHEVAVGMVAFMADQPMTFFSTTQEKRIHEMPENEGGTCLDVKAVAPAGAGIRIRSSIIQK